MSKKPIAIQSLNIDCPKCKAMMTFDCESVYSGRISKPHYERVRAMRNLIEDSRSDWVVRTILRERNFSR